MGQAMSEFVRGIWSLGWFWRAWVALLAAVNMIPGLLYIGRTEGQIIVGAMTISFLFMLVIVRAKGFVRLLGLPHLLAWGPMLLWLWGRFQEAGTGGGLGRWLLAVIIADGISFIIDLIDVWRYAAGDREPALPFSAG
jgi:hypothetical protein